MELFTPDFGLIFWMFIAFAILFFVLWKWGWPVIINSVEKRADLIDKGVEYAQSAKEQLDHAREAADKQLAEARRQQADMLRAYSTPLSIRSARFSTELIITGQPHFPAVQT